MEVLPAPRFTARLRLEAVANILKKRNSKKASLCSTCKQLKVMGFSK